VKRVEGGKMSNHINDTFSSGKEVEVMIPMGNFTTIYDSNVSRHLIFVGGGSGITPLFSMIKTVLSKEPNTRVDLVYGNTHKDQIIFDDDLTQLSSQYSQLKVTHILENDEEGYAEYSGRPNPAMINEIIDKISPQKDGEYFVCGPDGMMEMIKDVLHERGIGPERIKIESYSHSEEKSEEMSKSEEEGTCQARIELDGEVHELEIKKSKPVLEQALEAGLDMPYSCQSGLCTACRAKCLEGSVSTEKAEGLTQHEHDEGYVLLCVGKAKSNKISLEVG
jgi:ring-1,2-phenylacetyl-CoA epoxidase subunit PaaE